MMYNRINRIILGLLTVLFLSCNSSPTIPLPPPEATLITTGVPDADGIVEVVGAPQAAELGDIVLVFNDDTGDGAMKDANDDGSFRVPIPAQLNDIIIIQLKRGERLTPEVEKVVGE